MREREREINLTYIVTSGRRRDDNLGARFGDQPFYLDR